MNKRDSASLVYRALQHNQNNLSMDGTRQQALLKEYSEVSSNFRLLTDIRFKLLAFLPIATAAAAALKSDTASIFGLALSMFGLVVTLGLVTYNKRNDQLYNELVGRAASLERSLGLLDGGFANRPRAWLAVKLLGKKWRFDHGAGVGTIYVASITFWLFGVLASVLQLIWQAYVGLGSPSLFDPDSSIWWVALTSLWLVVPSDYLGVLLSLSAVGPSTWMNFVAFGLAVLLTWWAAKSIERQSEKRSESMRNAAKKAVDRVTDRKAVPFNLSRLRGDQYFLQQCENLSGDKRKKLRVRLRFYAELDQKSLGHYLPRGSNEKLSASHLVALLTDLPPQWILDCATGRKGWLPESSAAEAP